MASVPVRERPEGSIPTEERQKREAEVRNALIALSNHCKVLTDDPSTTQDVVLFKLTKLVLTSPSTRPFFSDDNALKAVQLLYGVLAQLSDPSDELFQLIDSLLDRVSLGQIISMSPAVNLAAGLAIGADQYNSLTLKLLESTNSTAAKRLATNFRNVFEALIRLLLCSHDIGISNRASAVLLKLLRDGNDEVSKRFFRDDGIYGAIFEICDEQTKAVEMSRTRRSIAQTRLLDFVASLAAWDWETAAKSHNPEVESKYGLTAGEGLLDFATRYQTNFEDDVLLHRTLIDTLKTLLNQETQKSWSGDRSPALEFLLSRKLHQQTIKYFLNPGDPSISSLDYSLLGPGSAAYTASFLDSHPNFVKNSPVIPQLILKPLQHALGPKATPDNLNVFSSIPRSVLLSSGIVDEISLGSNNPDLLKALAYVLGGPPTPEARIPPIHNSQLPDFDEENEAARKLFESYYSRHPGLFTELVSIANKTAFPDSALAALHFIHAIAAANWDIPDQGIRCIFADSRSRDAVLLFLRGFPNRPQGEAIGRDHEQQKIAGFRFALAQLFLDKLQKIEDRDSSMDVAIERLKARLRLGVYGPSATSVANAGM